jgi:murein L,D-transpeptidase YcbB/YkuD
MNKNKILLALFAALLSTHSSSQEGFSVGFVNDKASAIEETKLEKIQILVDRNRYKLHVLDENGVEQLSQKVIIGKPGRTTPLLETTIERIEFNPYWDVPTSIQHDVVQKASKHGNIANYFRDHGYRMIVDGKEVNPSTNNTNYRIRQDPGEGNMLGRIMFVLKNTGGVQMHDTPMKNLFNEDIRRFSSGCIRVENAVALASYILEIPEEDVMAHINEGRNKYVPVKKSVSVKIVD